LGRHSSIVIEKLIIYLDGLFKWTLPPVVCRKALGVGVGVGVGGTGVAVGGSGIAAGHSPS